MIEYNTFYKHCSVYPIPLTTELTLTLGSMQRCKRVKILFNEWRLSTNTIITSTTMMRRFHIPSLLNSINWIPTDAPDFCSHGTLLQHTGNQIIRGLKSPTFSIYLEELYIVIESLTTIKIQIHIQQLQTMNWTQLSVTSSLKLAALSVLSLCCQLFKFKVTGFTDVVFVQACVV